MNKLIRILHCSVQDSVTPWTAVRQASLSITNSRSLLKVMSIESVMPSKILSSVVPISSCPQSFPASGSFQMSQSSHEVAKVLEFQLQHQSFLDCGIIFIYLAKFTNHVVKMEVILNTIYCISSHQDT